MIKNQLVRLIGQSKLPERTFILFYSFLFSFILLYSFLVSTSLGCETFLPLCLEISESFRIFAA